MAPGSRPVGKRAHKILLDLLEDELPDGKDASKVLTRSYKLAERRAAIFERPISPVDVEYVLAYVCLWPLKPEPTPSVKRSILKVRQKFLTDKDALTDNMLALPIEEFYNQRARGRIRPAIGFASATLAGKTQRSAKSARSGRQKA